MKGNKAIAAQLKQLENFALEKGAYKARIFNARLVFVDERVRMKCQIPLCPHYGRSLTCPPNVPTVEEFKKALDRYTNALLIQTSSPIVANMNECSREEAQEFFKKHGKTSSKEVEKQEIAEDFGNMRSAAIKLHKLTNEVELQAMSLGFHYALGLIGGECMLCSECVGVCSSQACRRPYEARPSMEGVGIDVVQTCIKAGLPFEIPPTKEIVRTSLLLVD
jgi:predicted metal-binding protein